VDAPLVAAPVHLTPEQVAQIDALLGQLLAVSPHGELTIIVEQGRIKFVKVAPRFWAVSWKQEKEHEK
jgi:hypothetical protein